jgi:hypothetical protein
MTRLTLPVVPLLALVGVGTADERAAIRVDPARAVARATRHMTGACLEDVNHEVYGGLYSQMVFGESFQEPPLPPPVRGFTALGGRWEVVDGVASVGGGPAPSWCPITRRSGTGRSRWRCSCPGRPAGWPG